MESHYDKPTERDLKDYAETHPSHIKVITNVRQGEYLYFQLVCSCGYRGLARHSKVTAQMDECENEHFGS